MASKNTYGITLYSIGLALLLIWSILDLTIDLQNNKTELAKNNDLITYFFKGNPNLVSLISYILFTISAFIFLKEKKKTHVFIRITSFALLIFLFYKLLN